MPDLTGLRVLVLTSGHDALDGRVYDKQARSMMEMGADVTVVAWLDSGEIGPVPIIPVKHPHSRFQRFVLQPWRCVRAASDLQPDIIHFHDAEILQTLPIARRLWPQARFVYDVHEDFGNLLLIRDWLPTLLRTGVAGATHLVEKTLARLAHGVVGVTQPLTDNFSNIHRTTAYNFPSQRFYERSAQTSRPPLDREFDLVHLGTLNPLRARFLADVLRHAYEQRPSTQSLIFGCSQAMRSYLLDRVPPGCTVEGPVPYDEVAGRLGNARVGIDIHPWLSPHLLPAFAVKVAEYMASGCAVVASWMPVLEYVLQSTQIPEETCRVVRSETPKKYAAAVLAHLENIDRGENPGEALRQAAQKNLLWEREAEKIATLYKTLIRERDGNGVATN